VAQTAAGHVDRSGHINQSLVAVEKPLVNRPSQPSRDGVVHLIRDNDKPHRDGKVRHLSRRPLFLRWVVLQAVVATLLAAAGLAYSGQLHGASLAMVPLILAVLVGASGYAGLLAWRADEGASASGGLRHLWFAAGVCQLLGLLGTVAGFYAMFNHGGEATTTAGTSSDLATRVTHGAGVALSATFIGILASIVLLLEHHVLDEEP
jgi:MotA/TolQ/ExbB proton channel family